MAASPLPERHGIPGCGAAELHGGRVDACAAALTSRSAGTTARFFIGGEEETLGDQAGPARLADALRPEFVMHHYPSTVNAPKLRRWGMRNTLVNAWLHRPLGSALRWTAFTLADTPKNRDMAPRRCAWRAGGCRGSCASAGR